MTNAVRLKNGDIVAVDEKNIDFIDVNAVEHIFYSYYGQHLEGYGEVEGFQTGKLINGKFVYDDRPDMIERGWELYKQHVKTGEMLTLSKGGEIKDQVFDELFPQRKVETKVVWKRERKEDVENKKKKQNDISQMYREIFEEIYGKDLF